MSFYSDASLVMIPSGYKTSKVYSAVPTDGTGDLAFTRSNDTATRVASNGLIEKVRTNLVLNSATFVTQTITVGANPHTISFTGTGTIVITGTGSGTLVGTGAANRVSLSFTATAGALILTGTGTITLAQLETGDIATSYIATLGTAVSVGPLANVPRLDYLNSSCPRLLLEPQRTNLAQYSEQFDNAYWLKSSATITANTSVSPDGTQSADTAVITAGGYVYAEFISYAAVTGQSATISVFAKNQTANFLIFGGATTAGTDVYKIESYGNGWYRHSRVRTFTATATTTLQYLIAADIVGTHVIWGAQVEGSNSAYLTSYIPTLGASVTRGADACSKTGISSLIGQTEGVLFLDFVFNDYDSTALIPILLTNTSADQVYFLLEPNGKAYADFYFSSTFSASISTATSFLVKGTRYKMALAYKQNDFAFYINGQQIGTDNSGIVNSMTKLNFVYEYSGGYGPTGQLINQALLFKTRLSNSELASLTTI